MNSTLLYRQLNDLDREKSTYAEPYPAHTRPRFLMDAPSILSLDSSSDLGEAVGSKVEPTTTFIISASTRLLLAGRTEASLVPRTIMTPA